MIIIEWNPRALPLSLSLASITLIIISTFALYHFVRHHWIMQFLRVVMRGLNTANFLAIKINSLKYFSKKNIIGLFFHVYFLIPHYPQILSRSCCAILINLFICSENSFYFSSRTLSLSLVSVYIVKNSMQLLGIAGGRIKLRRDTSKRPIRAWPMKIGNRALETVPRASIFSVVFRRAQGDFVALTSRRERTARSPRARANNKSLSRA